MIHELENVMRQHYGIEKLRLEDNFKKDYGLTSFDFVNLICLIEEKFHMEFEEKDYRSLNTVEDLIQYIEQKTA